MVRSWLTFSEGMFTNAIAADQAVERGGLFFLLVWVFLLFTSTFAHMIIAGPDLAETGGNMANLLFSLSLIFCGLVLPLPRSSIRPR